VPRGGDVLDTGDAFPPLRLHTLTDGPVELPAVFGSDWGVLLIYRAGW